MDPIGSNINWQVCQEKSYQDIKSKISNEGWYITSNALRTFKEGYVVHVEQNWHVSVVKNISVKYGGDAGRALMLGQRAIREITEAEASPAAAGGVRIGHSNSSSAESVSRASSTTVSSKGDVTSVSGNTQQHTAYDPDQYIKNKINKDGWYITTHALLTLDEKTVQVGGNGLVFVENKFNKSSVETSRAIEKAVDIGSKVIAKLSTTASGPAGGVRRDYLDSSSTESVSRASSTTVSRGSAACIYVPYHKKGPEAISRSLLAEIKKKVTGGSPCMIVYSAGRIRTCDKSSTDVNLSLDTVPGDGAHAAMLRALSALLKKDQRGAPQIYAASVSLRRGTTRREIDSDLEFIKNKMINGYCILLIKNEDGNPTLPLCYGMKGQYVNSYFDRKHIELVQKTLLSYLTQASEAVVTGATGTESGLLGPYRSLGRNNSQARWPVVTGATETDASDLLRAMFFASCPYRSSGINNSQASWAGVAGATGTHDSYNAPPIGSDRLRLGTNEIAQGLGCGRRGASTVNLEQVRVRDETSNQQDDKLTEIAQERLKNLLCYGWFRVVPKAELGCANESDLVAQEVFTKENYGEVLAYQLMQANGDLQHRYVKAGDVVRSLSTLTELRSGGPKHYLFRCPVTRKIVAFSENKTDIAQPGKDAVPFAS